jgi:acyl carrier protein
MSTADQAIQTLRQWIGQRHPDHADIDEGVDLIQNKLIDSINYVEYILIIEELIGRDIPVTPDLVARTSSLALVREHFLQPSLQPMITATTGNP